MASPIPAIERLPDELPAGRPRVLHHVAAQPVAQVAGIGRQAPVEVVLGLLVDAARRLSLTPEDGGPVQARARWCDSGDDDDDLRVAGAVFGVPIPEDAGVTELAAATGLDVTPARWDYGLVGCIVPIPEERARSVDILSRHVREQGFSIAPGSYEEVFERESLAAPWLLLFRLERFY